MFLTKNSNIVIMDRAVIIMNIVDTDGLRQAHDRLLKYRRFPDNPLRGTGNLISEKSPYLNIDAVQFYMEIDRKLMFIIKTFILKLYIFYCLSYPLHQLSSFSKMI